MLLEDAMLRKSFAGLIPLLLCLSLAAVQADDEPMGWPVEQHCITPTKPPKGWTFDGTLITLGEDSNVRGLRSDLPTSYIIAFWGKDYTGAGALSPDAHWLAVPSGWDTWAGWGGRDYHITAIHVYSTNLPKRSYTISWEYSVLLTSESFMPHPQWLGNTQFYMEGYNKPALINPFDAEIKPFDDRDGLLGVISPDQSRTFIEQYNGDHFVNLQLLDAVTQRQLTHFKDSRYRNYIIWNPNSSEFAILAETDDGRGGVLLYDRDGRQGDIISGSDVVDGYPTAWSPDGRYLMLYHPTQEANQVLYTIRIADIQQKKVIDTCLPTSWLGQAAWSSDSQRVLATVMVNKISYAAVINLADQTAYRVQKDVYRVLGWRPAD
jgi:hypothetical protein